METIEKPHRTIQRIANMNKEKFLKFALEYWDSNKGITYVQFCSGLQDYIEVKV